MDTRLYQIHKQRPIRLRHEDLDLLARLMIAVIRGRGRAGVVIRLGTQVAVLSDNENRQLTIIKDDWEKIFPYLQDGTFDPLQTPAGPLVGYADPEIAYNEPVLDHADRYLYQRILAILGPLFPETFPTSTS